MIERKWRMSRLGSGDWAWPSNSALTMWRAVSYDEYDGTLETADGEVIRGTFWALLRFAHDPKAMTPADIDNRWDETVWPRVASLLPTRQAAIDYALRLEERRDYL